MLMTLILKIFLSTACASWSGFERELYSERRFIELEHVLLLQNDKTRAHLVSDQRKDLEGCRDIHDGAGGSSSLLKCIRFMSRENQLKLTSSQRKQLVSDLNILCSRFSEKPTFLTKSLKEVRLLNGLEWKKCHSALWKQVYLTVYASFPSDPIGALKLSKRAHLSMGADGFWSLKIQEMLK